jgi:hypothetical protein
MDSTMTETLPMLCAPGAKTDGWSDLIAPRLFRAPSGEIFCKIETTRGIEVVPIKEEQFRIWLRITLERKTGTRPSRTDLARIIEQLKDHAWQRARTEDIYIRVALAGGRVYLDLADDRGRAVEVGPDGWNVVDSAPVHFMRPARMRSLPVPERGGSIDDLRSIANVVDDGDFVLFVAWLLDALRNDGAHPVLVINGGEGTAKTTLVEIVRELVDPSWEPLGGLPQTERQVRAADGGYLRVYDNVPLISARTSDALCRLSTGKPAHPVIINGIGELVMRPDLADRSLFVNLAVVTDRERRALQEIWAAFERLRSKILGVLLDAVAHGLCALPTTRLDEMPRMADFAIWVTACEGALWPKGTFMSAYMENRAEAVEKLIETDFVAIAVRTLMVNRTMWSGTATELDGLLRAVTGTLEDVKGWPAEPRILSTRLRCLAPSLSTVGIMVTFDKVGHDRKRVITLSRREDRPDPPLEVTQPASTDGSEPEAVPDSLNEIAISSVRSVRNTGVEATLPEGAAGAADAPDSESQASASGKHAAATDTQPSESANQPKVKAPEQNSSGMDGDDPRP